ncbi:hypothetical protein WISP_51981 [Willisornis vidua]|uniref:Uncharacterized protein n=1 Tax=Willisornis vidua TaxID=1566151 RepID=A0ABQ9DJ63_9PASS|nr:hypothetical protein WISP_51981 [Willisornis vidua]
MREAAVPINKLLLLLMWAEKAGLFKLPSQLFDVTEWQELGDKLWNKAIDGGKELKILGPAWREVLNHLKQYQAEQKTAMAAQHVVDKDQDHHGQSKLFQTVLVAPGVEVPVLQNASEVQKAATAADTSHSAASTAEAKEPGCRPKAPRAPPLPPDGSSDSDYGDDTDRKHRDRGSQIPSALRHHPLPWDPPPPLYADVTDNIETRNWGKDVVIESEGGLLLRPKDGGNWFGIIRDALLESDWTAVGALESHCGFPVLQTTNVQGQAVETHKPFDWKLLQQLRSAVSQYQPHSELVKQMLGYVFSAELLSPNDCMALAKLLCTPSQYVQWRRLWEEECRKVVNTPRLQGNVLHGI